MRWISGTFGTDIHDVQMMNPYVFIVVCGILNLYITAVFTLIPALTNPVTLKLGNTDLILSTNYRCFVKYTQQDLHLDSSST